MIPSKYNIFRSVTWDREDILAGGTSILCIFFVCVGFLLSQMVLKK